jgi:tetratricopeptide (TPR) repeat protein
LSSGAIYRAGIYRDRCREDINKAHGSRRRAQGRSQISNLKFEIFYLAPCALCLEPIYLFIIKRSYITKITDMVKQKDIFPILILLFFCLITWFRTADAATLDKAQISALYSEAKDLFKQADEKAAMYPQEAQSLYSKSAMRYERIIREGGIYNGKIFYNLGNVYFRMNDTGRAILNYRRAELYSPNDVNLKQNLSYAREKRRDQIEDRQKTMVLKTLFFWHYDLSQKTRFVIFAVSFMLMWGFACVRIFIKRSFLKWCIGSAAVLSLLFAGSLAADKISYSKSRPGVIISSEVTARKGNSETYEPSFKDPLHSGTEFTLLEERGAWLNIELADARTCWVPSKDTGLIR